MIKKNYDNGQFTRTVSQKLLANDNRYSYIVSNPLRFITGYGLATPPTGLEPGQVGICFEAFIAAAKLGPGGIGHGDGRGHNGNNRMLTARVTVWAIIWTDSQDVYKSTTQEVAPSVIGIDYKLTDGSIIDLPGVATYRLDPSIGGTISLEGSATTDVQFSNILSKRGEQDFGAGVDVTVSIANGTNGGQQFGKDLQNNINPVKIALGKAIELASPAGTIDGSVTLRITGSGQVKGISAQGRPFPSYAAYSYILAPDGKTILTTPHLRQNETPPVENLTKPIQPFPIIG